MYVCMPDRDVYSCFVRRGDRRRETVIILLSKLKEPPDSSFGNNATFDPFSFANDPDATQTRVSGL